jgi:hypothetical protein
MSTETCIWDTQLALAINRVLAAFPATSDCAEARGYFATAYQMGVGILKSGQARPTWNHRQGWGCTLPKTVASTARL